MSTSNALATATTKAPAAGSQKQDGGTTVQQKCRMQHRIAFYGQYKIYIDPQSRLSWKEQVLLGEDYIAGNNRKVVPVGYYNQCVSELDYVPPAHRLSRPETGHMFLNEVSASARRGTERSDRYDVMLHTQDNKSYHVVHSCNVFDAMADIHYQIHVKGTSGGSGASSSNGDCAATTAALPFKTHMKALMQELYISQENASMFLSTCPFCRPGNNTSVRSTTTVGLAGTANVVTPEKASRPTPAASQALPRLGTNKRFADAVHVTPLRGIPDQAQDFVKCAQAIVDAVVDEMRQQDQSATHTIQMLPVTMVCAATERMLATQQEYYQAGKPTRVRLGYHYTRAENMNSIQGYGLLSKPERKSRDITTVHNNGAGYGDGVYVAANPYAYRGRYGSVGLLVAYLQGRNGDVCRDNKLGHGGCSLDSGTVDRYQRGEFVVLSKSVQCVPILEFDALDVFPNSFASSKNAALRDCQTRLQTIADSELQVAREEPDAGGRSVKTKVSSNESSNSSSNGAGASWHYVAPVDLLEQTPGFVTTTSIRPEQNWTCSICHCRQKRMWYSQITTCRHVFHSTCLRDGLENGPACPTCTKAIGPTQGKMPSGKMTIGRNAHARCAGYEHTGTICIHYHIYGGIQKDYHRHPGVRHGSAKRTAYLPDTVDGHRLLKRLEYAFMHGLTFTVGVSLKTKQDNAVTWASIPHKTALSGGQYGFPDPHHIDVCNNALDKLEVPAADDL